MEIQRGEVVQRPAKIVSQFHALISLQARLDAFILQSSPHEIAQQGIPQEILPSINELPEQYRQNIGQVVERYVASERVLGDWLQRLPEGQEAAEVLKVLGFPDDEIVALAKDISFRRIYGGVALSVSPLFMARFVVDHIDTMEGAITDQKNIETVLEHIPTMGFVFDQSTLIHADIPEDLKQALHVVVVQEGPGCEVALTHEQQEILNSYTVYALGKEPISLTQDLVALLDLAARLESSEDVSSYTLGTLGLTPEFIARFPEKARVVKAVLKAVQRGNEHIDSKSLARAIRVSLVQPKNLFFLFGLEPNIVLASQQLESPEEEAFGRDGKTAVFHAKCAGRFVSSSTVFEAAKEGDPYTHKNAVAIKFTMNGQKHTGYYVIREHIGNGGMGAAFKATLIDNERFKPKADAPRLLVIKQLFVELEEAVVCQDARTIDRFIANWETRQRAEHKDVSAETLKAFLLQQVIRHKATHDFLQGRFALDITIDEVIESIKEFSSSDQGKNRREWIRRRIKDFGAEHLLLTYANGKHIPHISQAFGELMRLDTPDIDVLKEFYYGQIMASGKSIGKRREEGEVFTETDVIEIGIQIAQALSGLAKHHMSHGDISSRNVFLDRKKDGTLDTTLIDFGLVRAEEGSEAHALLQAHDMVTELAIQGTPGYMAPEVRTPDRSGNISIQPKIDVYALGKLLYGLLTELPVDDPDFESHLRSSAIPDDIKKIITHATKTDPRQRYTASQMQAELEVLKLKRKRERRR